MTPEEPGQESAENSDTASVAQSTPPSQGRSIPERLSELGASLSLKSRFNSEVVWNLASVGILGVSGILINGFIASWRGAEALGVFNQVFAIYIMLSQIAVGGVHLSVLKHVSHHQTDRALCGQIAGSGLLLGLILSLPVAAMAWLLSDWIGDLLSSPDVARGMVLAAPGLVFFSLNKILLNALNGLRSMRAYAVLQAMRFILILGSVVIILAWEWPSYCLGFALTSSELILFLVTLLYVRASAVPQLMSSMTRSWFGEHISFGLRGFLAGLLSEMNTRVDILMLGYFTTDAAVGIYSFAAILAEGFCQIPLVVRRNLDPIFGRAFAEGDRGRIQDAARKVRRIMYPLMGAITILAVATYPLLLRLCGAESGLGPSWLVFGILMAGILVNAGYRPFLGIFIQGGRPGVYTLLILLAVASNIILNFALIPMLGIYGAATATSIVFVVEALLIVILARRMFAVSL